MAIDTDVFLAVSSLSSGSFLTSNDFRFRSPGCPRCRDYLPWVFFHLMVVFLDICCVQIVIFVESTLLGSVHAVIDGLFAALALGLLLFLCDLVTSPDPVHVVLLFAASPSVNRQRVRHTLGRRLRRPIAHGVVLVVLDR